MYGLPCTYKLSYISNQWGQKVSWNNTRPALYTLFAKKENSYNGDITHNIKSVRTIWNSKPEWWVATVAEEDNYNEKYLD